MRVQDINQAWEPCPNNHRMHLLPRGLMVLNQHNNQNTCLKQSQQQLRSMQSDINHWLKCNTTSSFVYFCLPSLWSTVSQIDT